MKGWSVGTGMKEKKPFNPKIRNISPSKIPAARTTLCMQIPLNGSDQRLASSKQHDAFGVKA
jgi:hypothetical protein